VIDEPAAPRPSRGAQLDAATHEDLDGYSGAELEARLAVLEAEMQRTRRVLQRKQSDRQAADALFSLGRSD
jgi:uncharacterized small protein (DUF1192 family)